MNTFPRGYKFFSRFLNLSRPGKRRGNVMIFSMTFLFHRTPKTVDFFMSNRHKLQIRKSDFFTSPLYFPSCSNNLGNAISQNKKFISLSYTRKGKWTLIGAVNRIGNLFRSGDITAYINYTPDHATTNSF